MKQRPNVKKLLEKVLHMCINKYIADQKIYHSFPENFECNDFCLEINFHCLSKRFYSKFGKNI